MLHPLVKYNNEQVAIQLAQLNQHTVKKWKIVENQLYKKFTFSSFDEAVAFIIQTTALAKSANHHPIICNAYKQVEITLFTFSIKGLSHKDFDMSTQLEQL